MKVKVIKRYVDKDTKSIMEPGTVVDYSESRAKELEESGYAILAAKLQKLVKDLPDEKKG